MTDTGSSRPTTQGEETTHRERHASISERNARGKARVDPSDASPQVRKSQPSEPKSRAPLPRDVTFSALSLGRAERDPRGGRDQQNTPATDGPEPIGPLAEKFLDRLAAQQADPDLAARQRGALDRLARAHRTRQETQP